jgi:hypothetical protein
MRFALFLVAALGWSAATPDPAELVPVRWPSADPATVAILAGSPINTLLIPEPHLNAAFIEAAHARHFTVLGLLTPGAPALPRARRALALGLDGIVLEGNFPPADSRPVHDALRSSAKLSVELGLRGRIPLEPSAPPIIGTYQGVWAGINAHDEKEAHAAPSGAPWIDTNAGFLRFVRACTQRVFWLSSRPPEGTVITIQRYLQMIADPAMVGARWVVTLEDDWFKRLLAAEPRAARDFKRLTSLLAFFEAHRALQQLPQYGQLAVLAGVPNGALLSGSVLDMITVKHTPIRPVPFALVSQDRLAQARMALNLDPEALSPAQRETLQKFAASGSTILTAPDGSRMPAPAADQLTIRSENVKKLDQIWREVNAMMGRRNLGVRLFNVSSMLSNMLGAPDASRVVIYLVNYADFPVDTIAVHLLGKFSKVTLHTPDRPARSLAPYDNEDGTGVDIDLLDTVGILVAEK